jgi:hypothetical protein
MATATAALTTGAPDGPSPNGQSRVAQFQPIASGGVGMEASGESRSPPGNAVAVNNTNAGPTSRPGSTVETAHDTVTPVSRPSSTPAASRNNKPSRAPRNIAAKAPHNGFAVLNLNPPATPQPGVLGPNRDGRVRNPVPSKLKGKTDGASGEFSVMHMDVSSKGRQSRSTAAQITSENTAEAAKSAQKGGYVSLKRRRLDEGTENSLSPQPPQPPSIAPNGSRFFPILPQQNYVPRTSPLTPEQTKVEQARLLTLLRSINPLTVVDHICKALAFFGGIPGAPPPADGIFPDSAESNGKGELFIGWLSEIFPELERIGWKPDVERNRDPVRLKRGRGRPKGSKATKARKDKGIKKGPMKKTMANGESPATTGDTSVGGDDGWVDVGEAEAHDDDSQPFDGVTTGRTGVEMNGEVSRQDRSISRQRPSTGPGPQDVEMSHNIVDVERAAPEPAPTTATPKPKGGKYSTPPEHQVRA